jgi:pyruvoyl-dependent arginine decarboxylase (PvlArgDC)
VVFESILGDYQLGSPRSEYNVMDVSSATPAAMEDVVEETSLKDHDDGRVLESDTAADSSPSWAGRIKSALMRSTSKTTTSDQLLNTTASWKDDEEGEGAVTTSVGSMGLKSSGIFRSVSPVAQQLSTTTLQLPNKRRHHPRHRRVRHLP